MKRLQIQSVMIFVTFFVLNAKASSQTLAADTQATPAFKNAINFYNATFYRQFHLFNGKEYADYKRPFSKGQPYFLTDTWNKGTVNYEGNTYSDVAILYNIVTDEVVILNYNQISKIQLVKNKLSAFAFAGHSFVNLSGDSMASSGMRTGFYDVLAFGTATLLARRTKNVQTFARQTLESEIMDKDYYYLKINGSYSPINTRKSLLKLLADKRKELQQFMKQEKLRYRSNPENTMVRVVQYYNQITK